MTLWKTLVVALVAAFALAACNGSSDSGPSQADLDAANERADAAEERAEEAEQRAEDAEDAQEQAESDRDDLQDDLDAVEDQQQEAQDRAAAAMARTLFAALDAIDGTEDPAATVTVTAEYGMKAKLSTTSIDVDGDGSGGSTTVADSAWTSPAGSTAGDWKSTDFMANKGKDHVRVYTNVGAGSRVAFSRWLATAGANGAAITFTTADGVITIATSELTANGRYIAASAFSHASGTVTHTPPVGDENKLVGTFGGAQGHYVCSGACTSAPLDGGGVTLTGSWSFEIAAAGAMATTPDSSYVHFGWWLHENEDGSYAVATFDSGAPAAAPLAATLTGSATYEGKASGKYATYPGPMGGAFTADVMLTAKFGDDTAVGTISGMVDNFTGDDMSDWSVTLPERTLGTDGNLEDVAATQTLPVWSMDGAAGDPAGAWTAQMHNPIAAGMPRAGTPQDVTGTFWAENGPTGRMAGAFGAELDN